MSFFILLRQHTLYLPAGLTVPACLQLGLRRTMTNIDVHELSGVELAHQFLVSCGAATLGSPKGPFAFYRPSTNALYVIGGSEEDVEYLSFETDLAYAPLQEAKRLGASFSVQDDDVICCIGSINASGATYSEAAMRATVLWLTSMNSPEA